LIHLCLDCGSVSGNRIAADDDSEELLAIFDASLRLDPHTKYQIIQGGILPLQDNDRALVCIRLFGQSHCQEQVLSYA
jgi:hypothetical protein